jgi:uncharacterized protein (DUF488 family)
MYYRRKIILALLQAFDGNLDKISLQKLLFLFTQRQAKADYDFVPYLYGCYSFSASADLNAMVGHGQLQLDDDENSFAKTGNTDYIKLLKDGDKKILIELKNTFAKSNANYLMRHTYLNFKYYAINSIKAKELLTEDQYTNIQLTKPKNEQTILYTIGYEGISLEEYLNRLIKNDIKVLVDVRNNPLSMKFGFSKNQLTNFCSRLGIEYLHIPEVGIQSSQRQELKTQTDYDNLFIEYKAQNLKQTIGQQEKILNLLIDKKRIALTCFEANICQCHRKHLSEAITSLPNWNFQLKHI